MENQQQNTSSKYYVGQTIGCLTLISKTDNRWTVRCNNCGNISDISLSTLSGYRKDNKLRCSQCPKEHISSKYRDGDIIGNCYKLVKFLGGNNWVVECTKCGRIQEQSIPNMKKHVKDTCYYCEHPNAQRNPKSNGGRKGVNLLPIDERIYNYYKSRIISDNNKGKKYKEWSLSEEDFRDIIHQPCHYCGSEPSIDNMWNNGASRKSSDEIVSINGIDRIDSNKGYTIDNCVPCCTLCNRMKSDLSTEVFLTHVNKICARSVCSTTIENTLSNGSE